MLDFLVSFGDSLNNIFDSLGSRLILPVFIFIFAIAFGVKIKEALRSALYIGIALTAIGMVVDFFMAQIGPSVELMAVEGTSRLTYLDVGWSAAAAIAYGAQVGLLIIPVALVVNLILLGLKLTETLNIDIWNYWHYAFVGGMAAALTGKTWLGFVAAVLLELFSLLLADMSQPSAQQYYGYEGVSFSTISSIEYIPFAILINKLLDKIGLGKVNLNPEAIKKRFGFLGEPSVLGFIIGFGIGLYAHSGALGAFDSWIMILTDAIVVATVMHVFPMMPRILMQGLMPLSTAIRSRFSKRGSDRKIFLGMDTALCVGETATLMTSLILIPIAIILMLVLPYNKFLWIADLLGFPWFVAMITPVTKGNILKNVIIGSLYLVLGNFIITIITPLFTQVAAASGFAMPAGVEGIGAGSEGISYLHFLIYNAMNSWVTIVIAFAVYALALWHFKTHKSAWYKAAGYVAEEAK